MVEREFIELPVKPGSALESQSGLQTNWPRVYGVLYGPPTARDSRTKTAAIVIHPSSNFMGHYLLGPLGARGVSILGLNTRYVNNDSVLIMERAIQDLGAGVRLLRDRGFEKVVLIGNSGGGALTAFYQAEAEGLTVSQTPAGDPIALEPADLPPADGIALAAAHLGRGWLLTNWMDASVIDEADPLAANPALDIYHRDRRAPFDRAFVANVRAAQRRRSDRITERARERLAYLRQSPDRPSDEAFLVFRTYADPVFLDLTIDPNDRSGGGNKGNPRVTNYGANNLARFCTLTSWLSQWSSLSRAYGPACLARTSVPVLQLEYTADESILPAHVAEWKAAADARMIHHRIVGANHYLKGQADLVGQVADHIAAWAAAL